jgi:hypothetical protein
VQGGQSIPVVALLQARGDWEWLEAAYRIRSVSSERFCWMCDATKGAGPVFYGDFRPNALHRATLISHTDYVYACARERMQPSALFSSPGFRVEFLTIDSMHAGDLGSFQDAVGSLLWLEINNRQWYRTLVHAPEGKATCPLTRFLGTENIASHVSGEGLVGLPWHPSSECQM